MKLLLLLLVLLFVGISYATIPQTINVHGILTNSTGDAENGTYTIVFKIWNSYTGGSQLWNETKSVTTDDDGIYSEILSKVDVNFSNQRYLSIKVENDSDMTPRINFTSVPSALYSIYSDKWDSLDTPKNISGYVGNTLYLDNKNNEVSIGTNNAYAPFHFMKDFPTGYANVYMGTNGSGLLHVDSGHSSIGTAFQIYQAGIAEYAMYIQGGINYFEGKVGIGVLSPTYALDVVGNVGFSEYIYHNDDTDTFIKFQPDQTLISVGNEYLLNLYEGSQDFVKLGDGGDVDIDLNDDAFIRGSDGYMGVNTESPKSLFQTFGSFATKVNVLSRNTTLDGTHNVILVNTNGGDVTITLPDVTGSGNNRWYLIKKIGTDINSVFIEGVDEQTVEAVASYEILGIEREAVILVGTNDRDFEGWWIMSSHGL